MEQKSHKAETSAADRTATESKPQIKKPNHIERKKKKSKGDERKEAAVLTDIGAALSPKP